jgi:hypothetical protein
MKKQRITLFLSALLLAFGALVPVALSPSAVANVRPGPGVGQWQRLSALTPMSAGNSVQGYGWTSRCLTILDANANPAWSHVNQYPCDNPIDNPFQHGGRPRWWLYGNTYYPGYYQVVNEHNGICLDVAYSSQAPGAQVIGYYCSNQANQMFSKVDIGNGTFALVAAHSNQCLTLDDFGNAYWATLLQDYCNFSPQTLRRQAWTAHGSNNTNDSDMVAGYLDGYWVNSTGIGLWGWALTPQAPSQPLGVRVTVNGNVVTPGGMRYISWGNIGPTSRGDVNWYWNYGYHNESGFSFAEPYVLPPGNHNVCVQAQSYGYYDDIACRVMSGQGDLLPDDGLSKIKTSDGRCMTPTGGFAETPYRVTMQPASCQSDDVYWHSQAVSYPVAGFRIRIDWDSSTCLRYLNGQATIAPCANDSSDIWVDPIVDPNFNQFNLRPAQNLGVCLTAGASDVTLQGCSGAPSQAWTDPVVCKRNWVVFRKCNYVLPSNVSTPTKNREQAALYAYQWRSSTNLVYSHKTQYPQGNGRAYAGNDENDCTNFVSQALKAGGFAYSGTWLYQNGSSLSAWQRAGGQGSLPQVFTALGRYGQSTVRTPSQTFPSNVRVGDVVGIDFGNHSLPNTDPNYNIPDGRLDHNMVVVEAGGTAKTTYVVYHTGDTPTPRTIDEVFGRVGNSNANYHYYPVNYPDGQ